MRLRSLVAGFATALAMAGLAAACDKGSPTAPSNPPPGPPAPTITRIEIAGPDTIPPAQTAQFTATAHQSDGSIRDITSQATWRSSRTAVLTVSASGLATAHDRGESTISAQIQPLTATAVVVVAPAGTYRLAGTVHEAGTVINGALVEVTGGSGAGLSAATSAGGRYALYGVAGDTELRVTKDEYQEHVQRLAVSGHQTLDVQLTPSRPRVDLSGLYTLTITADNSCAAVPEEDRNRTYTAVVTQEGPRVLVRLEGVNFVVDPEGRGDRFTGTLDTQSENATFFLRFLAEYYYPNFIDLHPDVIERLPASRFLVISGSVTTPVSASSLASSLKGSVEIIESADLRRFTRIAGCSSSEHGFRLSR
jgi:hypothetical protein